MEKINKYIEKDRFILDFILRSISIMIKKRGGSLLKKDFLNLLRFILVATTKPIFEDQELKEKFIETITLYYKNDTEYFLKTLSMVYEDSKEEMNYAIKFAEQKQREGLSFMKDEEHQ
jgi:hypothetical protein